MTRLASLAVAALLLSAAVDAGCGPPPDVKKSAKKAASQANRRASRAARNAIRRGYERHESAKAVDDAADADDDDDIGVGEDIDEDIDDADAGPEDDAGGDDQP